LEPSQHGNAEVATISIFEIPLKILPKSLFDFLQTKGSMPIEKPEVWLKQHEN
jgi:hypothetical protein